LLGPPLAPLPQLQLCPGLRAPELDTGLPGRVSVMVVLSLKAQLELGCFSPVAVEVLGG